MDKTTNKDFCFQPTLTGETLSLRALHEDDFDELYACASDKRIWEGHPSPDRYKLSEFKPYFESSLNSKANVVVKDIKTNKIIGMSRYYQVDTLPMDISIGFTFLAREYWGGATNKELKTLMIDYAFQFFPTVWLHVGAENIRSQKAVMKIGAEFIGEQSLVIGDKQANWLCYKIEKEN